MQIAAVAININLLVCIILSPPLRLQTFPTSDFPSKEMFDFFPPSSRSLPSYIYRISFRGWEGRKRDYDGSSEDCPSCQTSLFFPSFCIQTSLLIRLSDFHSQTSQFVNIWKHFHLTLCHSRNRCKQTLQMKSATTLCYQMWALGLGSSALTNGNSYIT